LTKWRKRGNASAAKDACGMEDGMSSEDRREELLQILVRSGKPISGADLAAALGVSRQVIVQDIALLRANGMEILSTNRGYVAQNKSGAMFQRVFKVIHTEAEAEKELNLVVDLGGIVKDVFIYHKAYGVVRADMNIKSRRDVKSYMEKIKTGKSSLLMNVTAGYHYHTILAEDEETLDLVFKALQDNGFLAQLQDYEPVNFWE
jgi:hypothetical protein